MESDIFLLLGTNQGDRNQHLLMARELIDRNAGKILRFSSIYKTAAWGNTDQPEFYNQVIEIETNYSPSALLIEILRIEELIGRKRLEKWGPRVIDIDILFFKDEIIDDTLLKLPHPGIPERRFTLIPMVEIAPEREHPVLKKSMQTLLLECPDTLSVEIVK
jgi:2-amino-4-hydroxy-6-hydroxymethyldihydropteridine diphosphokinase